MPHARNHKFSDVFIYRYYKELLWNILANIWRKFKSFNYILYTLIKSQSS